MLNGGLYFGNCTDIKTARQIKEAAKKNQPISQVYLFSLKGRKRKLIPSSIRKRPRKSPFSSVLKAIIRVPTSIRNTLAERDRLLESFNIRNVLIFSAVML